MRIAQLNTTIGKLSVGTPLSDSSTSSSVSSSRSSSEESSRRRVSVSPTPQTARRHGKERAPRAMPSSSQVPVRSRSSRSGIELSAGGKPRGVTCGTVSTQTLSEKRSASPLSLVLRPPPKATTTASRRRRSAARKTGSGSLFKGPVPLFNHLMLSDRCSAISILFPLHSCTLGWTCPEGSVCQMKGGVRFREYEQ